MIIYPIPIRNSANKTRQSILDRILRNHSSTIHHISAETSCLWRRLCNLSFRHVKDKSLVLTPVQQFDKISLHKADSRAIRKYLTLIDEFFNHSEATWKNVDNIDINACSKHASTKLSNTNSSSQEAKQRLSGDWKHLILKPS